MYYIIDTYCRYKGYSVGKKVFDIRLWQTMCLCLFDSILDVGGVMS